MILIYNCELSMRVECSPNSVVHFNTEGKDKRGNILGFTIDSDVMDAKSRESEALNGDNENNNKQKHRSRKVRSILRSDYMDIFLKGFFVLLSIPFFISILFFSVYDTQCILFDHASVVNCSQNFFTSNPEHWVFAWLLMSMISTFILFLIIYVNHKVLNYQVSKAKTIYKNGSFGSLIFLLIMTVIYYGIRINAAKHMGTIRLLTSILVLLWLPVKFLLVCCFNYLPRVRWQKISAHNSLVASFKQCLIQNSNFIIYWLSLLLYFIEVACKLASIMLDVALEVAPLIKNDFPDHSVQLRGVMIVVIGFRLAFHASLLNFFWEKIFHGETDTFSEPPPDLLEKSAVENQQKTQKGQLQEEDIPSNEI